MKRRTIITIKQDHFFINGDPTYKNRTWKGENIEGLLFNIRMVQGIFDDRNLETVQRWMYPDTGKWDPDRNTQEFITAMPLWHAHGVLAFTINLQGGSPQGYSVEQPWHNSAFESDGALCSDYLSRLEKILNKADELGMIVILGLFYFGQDHRLKDETALIKGVDNTLAWLKEKGYTNILIEINNECNVCYTHPILRPERVHELIIRAKENSPFPVSTSYGGGFVPLPNVVSCADFLLIHGNGVDDPARITEMVLQARAVEGYSSKPILINEDDHFEFSKDDCNLKAAVAVYCSWGYFDPGKSNYCDGYQCLPVNWDINTERKKQFFNTIALITQGSIPGVEP